MSTVGMLLVVVNYLFLKVEVCLLMLPLVELRAFEVGTFCFIHNGTTNGLFVTESISTTRGRAYETSEHR